MARTARSGDAESCAYAGDHQLQLTQGDQGTMPQPPFWLLFIRVRRRRILRTSPYRISRKSSCGMRHRRTGDTARGYAAPTFTQWGTPPARVPHSPPGCYQSTSPPRRKRPFAAYAKVVGMLQCVTISSSRVCLYPPSKAARLFCWLRPGPVRRLSYVHHRCQVMCRT
jgi:hypothetical protein